MVSVSKTPNPLARQFASGAPFFNAGSYAFYTQEDAQNCPLAQELLNLDIVAHVLITPLFITVTLVDEALWHTQEAAVFAVVERFIKNGDSIITKVKQDGPQEGSDDLFSTVESLLQKHAMPAVAEHGGHIRLVKIEDGIVYLELQGACDGCPSALVTLKSGIENLLCFYVPSIKEVRAINLDC